MMTQRRIALVGSSLAALMLMMASSLPASAAISSGNGMQVSPVTTNLTMNPGESQVVGVNIVNVTNAPETLQVAINDFTADGESGAPALLLNPGQYAPVHSLKRFVEPIANISLSPHEQRTVKVLITIPKGTSGGGYYGAVRFAPAAANQANNVSLTSSVASLILVRVTGNFKEQLNLASIDVRGGIDGSPSVLFTSSKNLVAAIRFQNVGDVQEQPFGKLDVRQGGKIISSYEINTGTPRANVLPSSVRRFNVTLTKVGWLGKYTVYGNFGYGTNGQLVSGQTTFYVIPWVALLGALLLLGAAVFFIGVFPKLKKQYDRGVLARARRR